MRAKTVIAVLALLFATVTIASADDDLTPAEIDKQTIANGDSVVITLRAKSRILDLIVPGFDVQGRQVQAVESLGQRVIKTMFVLIPMTPGDYTISKVYYNDVMPSRTRGDNAEWKPLAISPVSLKVTSRDFSRLLNVTEEANRAPMQLGGIHLGAHLDAVLKTWRSSLWDGRLDGWAGEEWGLPRPDLKLLSDPRWTNLVLHDGDRSMLIKAFEGQIVFIARELTLNKPIDVEALEKRLRDTYSSATDVRVTSYSDRAVLGSRSKGNYNRAFSFGGADSHFITVARCPSNTYEESSSVLMVLIADELRHMVGLTATRDDRVIKETVDELTLP